MWIYRDWSSGIIIAIKFRQLEIHTPPAAHFPDVMQEFIPNLVEREHLWITYNDEQASSPRYGNCVAVICQNDDGSDQIPLPFKRFGCATNPREWRISKSIRSRELLTVDMMMIGRSYIVCQGQSLAYRHEK